MASEPPCAEPHAEWCGEGERETRPYPIMHFYLTILQIHFRLAL